MYSSILSGTTIGIDAFLVRVEVDITTGLPGINLVGYLSTEAKEAKERVMIALKNAGFKLPPSKITINLSPANIKKGGTGFDVAIAIGMLVSMRLIPAENTKDILFIGELGLNGEIKPVSGILPIIREATHLGIRESILPYENRQEGSILQNGSIRAANHINQLVKYLMEKEQKNKDIILPKVLHKSKSLHTESSIDFSDVKGQHIAKRAAEIAAAGFHNFLMIGPPGGGKSMIAKRIPTILPLLSQKEELEVSSIYSIAGVLPLQLPLYYRPYQNPHHTISSTALIGGGSHAKPGIISLSHRGVLFLDEITQFPRYILETLRQPIENHEVTISRINGNYKYPAHFMLVGAMNPCKCGYYPDLNRCHCTTSEREKYFNKISGPIIDRIDLFVNTDYVELSTFQKDECEEGSFQIKQRIERAVAIQKQRFQNTSYYFNSEIEGSDIEKFCKLDAEAQELMNIAYTNLQLTGRSYHRVLKVARTIADLKESDEINVLHLSEALSYRGQYGKE